MSDLQGQERGRYVRAMFAGIAHRYDLLNRLMTFGRDVHWRRETVGLLDIRPGAWVLDLGSGTGDLALEIASQHPGSRVVAADFTPEMLDLGRKRDRTDRIQWVIADALALPFASRTFQGCVSGFLMRNVSDPDRALAEQRRVLQPGADRDKAGRIAILETTPPRGWMAPLIALHLRIVIPMLGALISGQRDAYRYLPATTQAFLTAEDLARRMREAGFDAVSFVRKMFGTIAIHTGLAHSEAQDD